jgi:Tfp pilus assembly pilus retraction ATPase PilT
MYSMSDLLQLVVAENASDLHLRVGCPPVIRLHGVLHRVEGPTLKVEDTEELMRSITSDDNVQHVRERGGCDFGFAFGDLATNQQEQIRIQLSTVLQAVISQLLIPRIDKPGRVAVFEIMINTPSIGALIRDNKTFRINSDIQTGAKYGMVTLDSFLVDKYQLGMISEEEVITKSQDPSTIMLKLQELEAAEARRQASG